MVDPHTNGCPEPEVLAAYVDRGLSLSERARVDAHLASCPQCIALVAGVARTVEELSALRPDVAVAAEATPLMTRRSVAGALAAAAAVIAVLATPALVRPWLERDSGLVSLVDSVGEQRSVLGRLTGGFPHAPLGAPSAGGQDGRAAGTDRVQLTAGRIRESFGERETPSQLHALGVSQLLAGRYDDAAQSLLAASREQPANAQYLSDVAAVQIERARLGLRPDDLPRALAAADRARRLDPSLKEAWFNRALAASRIVVDGGSARARGPNTSNATARRRGPPKRDRGWRNCRSRRQRPRGQTMEGRLQSAFDASTADEAVRTQTTEARNFIETRCWSTGRTRCSTAASGAAELDRVRTMAQAMQRVAGDASVRGCGRRDRSRGRARQRSARDWRGPSRLRRRGRASTTTIGLQRGSAGLTQRCGRVRCSGYSVRAFGRALDLGVHRLRQRSVRRVSAADRSALRRGARATNYRYASARCQLVSRPGRVRPGPSWRTRRLLRGHPRPTFERMGDAEQVAARAQPAGRTVSLSRRRRQRVGTHGTPRSRARRSRGPRNSGTGLLINAGRRFAVDRPLRRRSSIQDAVVRNARAWGRDAAIAEALAQRAASLVREPESARCSRTASSTKRDGTWPRCQDQSFAGALEMHCARRRKAICSGRATRPPRSKAADDGDRHRVGSAAIGCASRNCSCDSPQANIVWGRTEEAEVALERGHRGIRTKSGVAAPTSGRSRRSMNRGSCSTPPCSWRIKQKDYERAFALAEARPRPHAWSKRNAFAQPEPRSAVQRRSLSRRSHPRPQPVRRRARRVGDPAERASTVIAATAVARQTRSSLIARQQHRNLAGGRDADGRPRCCINEILRPVAHAAAQAPAA